MFQRRPLSATRDRYRQSRTGIARRDIIVSLFVVGLLICVLVLWIPPGREDSRRTTCQHRQWAVAKAILEYEAVNGQFPGYQNLQAEDAMRTPRPTGWVFPLLPYLRPPRQQLVRKSEGGDLGNLAADNDSAERPPPPYLQIFEEYGPAGPDERRGQPPTRSILELICPSGAGSELPKTPNRCYWIANAGMPDAPTSGNLPPDWPANGVFLDLFGCGGGDDKLATSVAFVEEHDGAESTLLLSENMDAGEWTDDTEAKVGFVWWPEVEGGPQAPAQQILRINERAGEGDGSIQFARPSSLHRGGVNVVFVSGRQQFLNQQINELVVARLMMSNSREAKFPGTDQPVPPPYR
jgi:hypothetical protein